MATLDSLKWALRNTVTATASFTTAALSDSEYGAGFDTLLHGAGRQTYREFIIPQLSLLLSSLFGSRTDLSVLEIGPGPESVLQSLSSTLRGKIKRYVAFEPNGMFASQLRESLSSNQQTGLPFPYLVRSPSIYGIPFALDDHEEIDYGTAKIDSSEKFDVVLFCHSMYGMKPKGEFIEKALNKLREQPSDTIVVVFHRDEPWDLNGLVCHRTATFPTAKISIADNDDMLDRFALLIAGFTVRDANAADAVETEWRKTCRSFSHSDSTCPGQLLFNSPEMMMTFTQQSTMLSELTAHVPEMPHKHRNIKNREARLHRPAAILRPTEILHVQQCVRWALDHRLSLTVVGGSHGGHCLRSNVVAIDMSAFNEIHICAAAKDAKAADVDSSGLVVVEAGCKTDDVIRKTMAAGFTVPLGSRPSVGAGLWLQGGIGHLARAHGLTCDAIVGAVLVSAASGQILCIGHVPNQHKPLHGICPDNGNDMLWAIKGAGTNFGVVISVTFRAFNAGKYSIRSWTLPLSDHLEAQLRLEYFDSNIAQKLGRNSSADAYLYWDAGKLHLGVTLYETYRDQARGELPVVADAPVIVPRDFTRGSELTVKTADGVEAFEAEMYMSLMHGGHGASKTSAFKRCVFLKRIGNRDVANALIAAIQIRPSPLCYLHLLQGGGAVNDVADQDSAFGCRGWDFACVITGVWPRDQDGTVVARAAVQWVYDTIKDLLPLSVGVYCADLGPDPRDAALAAKAFGPNLLRLSRLKRQLDPAAVLAHACPLPRTSPAQKLIVLITGNSCAGKDYTANIWASVFTKSRFTARVVSISDEAKREYAAATGADLDSLLSSRAYKEKHRTALTESFQEKVRENPRIPEANFLNIVHDSAETDVLLITGMREQAPLARYSDCVPHDRLLEVSVRAPKTTRQARRGDASTGVDIEDETTEAGNTRPSLVFNNDTVGNEAAERFCKDRLLPFCNEDLQQLADMVSTVADFPRPGVEFRHVLDISQRPGGLTLCTSLLRSHFTGDWTKVDALVCCEAGGFIFASALATQVDVPLALVRKAGKLPAPTLSANRLLSHISSLASKMSSGKGVELGRDVIPRGAVVVVVDDVLATGETICAVLSLLKEATVRMEDVRVMVVAEFPFHRGRELLRQRRFGGISVQSLLVFGGA